MLYDGCKVMGYKNGKVEVGINEGETNEGWVNNIFVT